MQRIICSILMFLGATAVAGGTVPNGGDMATCRPGQLPNTQIVGYYSYDYIAGLSQGYPETKYINEKTLEDYNGKLLSLLGRASGRLKDEYSKFLLSSAILWKEVSSEPLLNSRRVWIVSMSPTRNSTVFIAEGLLEPQCQTSRFSDGFYLLNRIVNRQVYPNGEIHFWANKFQFQKMVTQNPLQGSIVLVHEWLWEHFSNATNSRQVNLFLHSKKAEEMDTTELRRRLTLLGLEI